MNLARTFKADASREACVFLPLDPTCFPHCGIFTHQLAKGYFGDKGMLAYVEESTT